MAMYVNVSAGSGVSIAALSILIFSRLLRHAERTWCLVWREVYRTSGVAARTANTKSVGCVPCCMYPA